MTEIAVVFSVYAEPDIHPHQEHESGPCYKDPRRDHDICSMIIWSDLVNRRSTVGRHVEDEDRSSSVPAGARMYSVRKEVTINGRFYVLVLQRNPRGTSETT
jgi:hypothetical protein